MALAAMPPIASESVFDIGKRLAGLLEQAEQDTIGGELPENVRDRIADLIESLRRRFARNTERDPRSLFDLDERLIELMDQVEDAAAEHGEIPSSFSRRSMITSRRSARRSIGSRDTGAGSKGGRKPPKDVSAG
jgi:hypothetical protein